MAEAQARPKPYQSVLERFPKHVHAIGMIAIEMNNLEIFLGEMLGGVLRIHPDLGQLIYLTPRVAMGRLDMLHRAASTVLVADSQGLKHVQKLVGRARAIMQRRHLMTHEAWGVSGDEVLRTPLPLYLKEGRPVPLVELQNEVAAIRELIGEVLDTTQDLVAASQREIPVLRPTTKKAAPKRPGKAPKKAAPKRTRPPAKQARRRTGRRAE